MSFIISESYVSEKYTENWACWNVDTGVTYVLQGMMSILVNKLSHADVT